MTKNNLINCKDCSKEISRNAESCPHCGTQMYPHNKMKSQYVLNIALMPIVAGLFFMFATMMNSAEKGGMNLIFWSTFFILTFVFYHNKRTTVKRAEYANWKYKENSSTIGTILLYFPVWTVYVWSFVAAVNIHTKHNNFLEDLSGSQMITIYLLIWLIGYRFFLKYFKLI